MIHIGIESPSLFYLKMVYTRFNGFRHASLINEKAHESAVRCHDRGRGRWRVIGRGRGREAPNKDEDSVEQSL